METYRKSRYSEWFWGYVLIGPSLLLFLVFVLIPIISSVVLSFYKWNMLSPASFAGLDNYKSIVSDKRLGTVLSNTFYFAALTVAAKMAIGLLLAKLVADIRNKWVVSLLESAYFFPILLPFSVVAMVWGMFFNTDFGVVNGLLQMIGLNRIPWFTDMTWALRSIMMLDIWKGLGFFFIIYLVALRNVPREFYEAADIDGAGKMQMFWRISIPHISPTSFFLLITSLIGGLQVFDPAYILTRGGPGDATRTIVLYLWETAFQKLNMGYGTTLAIMLFFIVLIITLLQFVLGKRWVHYD